MFRLIVTCIKLLGALNCRRESTLLTMVPDPTMNCHFIKMSDFQVKYENKKSGEHSFYWIQARIAVLSIGLTRKPLV